MKARGVIAVVVSAALVLACSSDDTVSPNADGGADAGASDAAEAAAMIPCGMNQTMCLSGCVFTASDSENCGACDHVCDPFASGQAACVDSKCVDPACGTGSADCNNNPADGCELDVTGTDAKNCGSCGHVCDTGKCGLGLCDPTVLAQTGLVSPFSLALSGTDLFVADRGKDGMMPPNGQIVKLPAAGGPLTVLAPAQTSPRDIAVDAQYVYYTNGGASAADGSIMKVGRDGTCGAAPTCPIVLAPSRKAPRAIALDDTYVYWGEKGLATNQYLDGGVYRVKKDGTAPVETVVSPTGAVGALVVNDTSAFYGAKGHIFSATKSGGTGVDLASGNGGIAIAGTTLFVGDSARVMSAGLDGSAQKVILPASGGLALVADGADLFLYVTTSVAKARGDGSCPGGGTCPVKMLSLSTPLDPSTSPMAVDATFLYAASPDGRVLRVPR
jgi:hypothetical protein